MPARAVCESAVHPPSTTISRTVSAPPAPARCPCGTRECWRTVAPFRAWRGWSVPVAQDPAFVAACAGLAPRDGAS